MSNKGKKYIRHRESIADRIVNVLKDDTATVDEIMLKLKKHYLYKRHVLSSVKARLSECVKKGILRKISDFRPAQYYNPAEMAEYEALVLQMTYLTQKYKRTKSLAVKAAAEKVRKELFRLDEEIGRKETVGNYLQKTAL